jgi:hypothetical protein
MNYILSNIHIILSIIILILCIIIYYKFIRNHEGFADAHPSKGTLDEDIDCSKLPRSVNKRCTKEDSTFIGCVGAVWSNCKPSHSYCDGKDEKYPWFKKCCTWEENECKPKSTTTAAATTAAATTAAATTAAATTAAATTAALEIDKYKIELNTDKLSNIIYPFKLTNNGNKVNDTNAELHQYLKALEENNIYHSLFRNYDDIKSFIDTNHNNQILVTLENEYEQKVFLHQLNNPQYWINNNNRNRNEELESYVKKYRVELYIKLNTDGNFKIQIQHSNGKDLTSKGDIFETHTFFTFDALKKWWNNLDEDTVFYNEQGATDYGFGFKSLYPDNNKLFETQYTYLIKHHGHYHTHSVHSDSSTSPLTNQVIWQHSDTNLWPHIHNSEGLTPFYTPFESLPAATAATTATTATATTA